MESLRNNLNFHLIRKDAPPKVSDNRQSEEKNEGSETCPEPGEVRTHDLQSFRLESRNLPRFCLNSPMVGRKNV